MIQILVFNPQTWRIERFWRNLSDPMPYSLGRTLSVREFRGRSNSNLIWTDLRAIQAWNRTREQWGRPIHIGAAFRRLGEGGHANQSQHYAGMAFDVGQNLSDAERNQLRQLAIRTGAWTFVDAAANTPTWVHFDRRLLPPACAAGFPLVRYGARGAYVCTLQDALNTGGQTLTVDGIFGPRTRAAVIAFQRANGLVQDGIVGCLTWTQLTALTNGALR